MKGAVEEWSSLLLVVVVGACTRPACLAPEFCSSEVPLNLFARLVTNDTYSHDLIGPCALAGQLPADDGSLHVVPVTAALSSLLDCGANAAVSAAARKAFELGAHTGDSVCII